MAANPSLQPEPAEEQILAAPDDLLAPEELETFGVNMTNLMQEFLQSIHYTEQFIRDFADLDNLVDGVPINKQENTPFVGDTTMAGLVRSIPRQSLKQLPVLSASVNGSKASVASLMCTFLLKKTAFNENTFGKGLLATLQMGGEQAITHGYAPFMVASGTMYQDFGTTMRLMHPADVGLEPGVSDSNESAYHFVVAHLTKPRIKRILAQEEGNSNTPWNIPALKQLLESDPVARNYTKYESDPKKVPGTQDLGKAYEIVTRYETGAGSKSVTFCPQLAEAPLRVLDNRSKWGYPKVQYLVIDPAALTPFGTSRVRLASPNQNFMNIYYGNTASTLLLNSNPPLLKRGMFNGPTPLKRGAVWETTDTNADISLKTMDNGALEQFVSMANYFSAQINTIMGGQSLTANTASPGSIFGKTAPGVEAGQAFMGVEANQIAKILENFLRQYALVALDTLLSEQSGTDEVVVDDDTRLAINQVTQKITGQDLIGLDNVFHMDWEAFYAGIKTWEINVDVSISPNDMEAKQRAELQDMLVVLTQNAQALGPDVMGPIRQITDTLLRQSAPEVSQISLNGATPGLAGNQPQAEPAAQPEPLSSLLA